MCVQIWVWENIDYFWEMRKGESRAGSAKVDQEKTNNICSDEAASLNDLQRQLSFFPKIESVERDI